MTPAGGVVTVPPTTISPTTMAPTPVVPPATSDVPSIIPSIVPSSSMRPIAPNVTMVDEMVTNIYLLFPNVSANDFTMDNVTSISDIQTEWFYQFYQTNNEILVNLNTTITITQFGTDGDDTSSMYIWYDQSMQYEPWVSSTSTNDTSTSTNTTRRALQTDADGDAPKNASFYVTLPFKSEKDVAEYTASLQEAFPDSFANVGTIGTPLVDGMTSPPAASPTTDGGDKVPVSPSEAPSSDRISDPIIAVIILACVAGVALVAGAAVLVSRRSAPKAYVSPYEPTPSAALMNKGIDDIPTKTPLEPGTFVVYAPAGKLGFSLDQPDPGPLVIFVVKEDSPLHDYIQSGDRLIGVDELNVRKSSPARVVGLLRDRSTSPYRKLTLIRSDETSTVNDLEGQYVVYAPPEKLGFSLEKSVEEGSEDANIAPTVRAVKPTSILNNSVEVGDELIGIDELDTRTMSAQQSVGALKSRSQNPVRKLTFLRIIPTAAELAAAAGGESKYDEGDATSEGYVIAFAPAGPLGFSLESPDSASMVVHTIKTTSPLVEQVKRGDKLIGVDDVDVRNLSPNRIVNLLATRKTNIWRKLTLLRRGATVSNLGDSTIQLDEGIIVVYVPATKLGFSLNSVDDGAPIFEIIKEDSILGDTARVGDRLVRIDEKDTSTMHAGAAVKLLNARKANPYRKLVIQRGSNGGASTTVIATPVSAPTIRNMDGDKYTVVAPAGKLGVILDNPDDGAPVIHTVKDTSPLLGKINVGDRLVNIDAVDVSGFTPAQVVQLLSTKSTNPERLLTMLRPPPMTTAEPEIVVGTDGESTVGGEYIEDTGDEATAATGDKE